MVFRASFSLVTLCLILVGGAVGCGRNAPAADPQHYAEDARQAYQSALESFLDRDWEEARVKFQEVKRKYGYSQYARLSELRLADIDFEEEKFASAITSYRAFTHDHRSDDSVPYARFRVCRSLYNQISDPLLLPPQEERDQAATFDAYRELSSFLDDYANSRWTKEALFMLVTTTARLMRHELYVARYYLRQDNFEAAAGRVRYALRHYEGSGFEPEAMVLLAETYLKMKRADDAREVLQQLLSQYPASPFVKPAKNFLAAIGTTSNGAQSTAGPPVEPLSPAR